MFRPFFVVALVCVCVTMAGASCGSHSNFGGGDAGGDGSIIGNDGGVGCNPCNDFPSTPIFDNGAPQNAPQLFQPAGSSSGGPCLSEPEIGSLFPNNWLRPRFVFTPASGENLFEIRIHADAETNDLLVYTTATNWTMPDDIWKALALHVENQPITVTVRGLDTANPQPATGTSGPFTIAPVPANGSMVYWATLNFDSNAQNTKLEGFHVGDDNVVDALETTQVQEKVRATWGNSLSTLDTQVQCIGCHTSTPDGKYAAFTAQWPWPNALASVEQGTQGAIPPFLTASAQSALSPNVNGAYNVGDVQKYMLGIQTFSKAHYQTGDRIVVTTEGSAWYRQNPTDPGQATGVVAQLVWFDLEASSEAQGTAWDVIARTNDSNSAAAPSWSHDGNTIAYVSTDTGAEDGRVGEGSADIALVPYNAKAGGSVTKVAGASDPAYEEYYPAFSPDDSLLAFNRVGSNMSMYNQPAAEVFVIPASGGTATRIKANDPVACLGVTSPGVQNTWPKWAPDAETYGGSTYYWLIFSSKRAGSGLAQLYITAVVKDGSGNLTTYASIYLWNQDQTLNNLVPAWDNFNIPPVVN